jgi:RNA polymerase sigma factor (sigma-70 family)
MSYTSGYLTDLADKRPNDLRTDNELFMSYKKGNQDDGAMLFAFWYPRIVKWVLTKTRNFYRDSPHDGEDVAMETLLCLIRNKNRFDNSKGDFKGWMWSFASGNLKAFCEQNRYKIRKPLTEEMEENLFILDNDLEKAKGKDDNFESLDAKQMKVVMHMLPEKQRQALELYYTQDVTQAIAAKEMGLTRRLTFLQYLKLGAKRCRELWDMIKETCTPAEVANPRKIKFLSTEEAAEMIGCSEQHIRRAIYAKHIDAYRLGHKVWKLKLEWVKIYKKWYDNTIKKQDEERAKRRAIDEQLKNNRKKYKKPISISVKNVKVISKKQRSKVRVLV